jgi:hypothetical protein
MQFERRALYNLLRMNWLRDESIDAEPWQVEDYRAIALDELFHRLRMLGLDLQRKSFTALADDVDSPEEMVDGLVDESVEVRIHDAIYLLIFEIWRRLVPEKTCLSIFCDELDHQINLYDTGEVVHPDDLQDALANFQNVLDENVDEGGESQEVFSEIVIGCANDVESFLYDFIAEQIDNEDYQYAGDLIEGFYSYVQDPSWFDFLRARLISLSDLDAANRLVKGILEDDAAQKDSEFLFEILSFMVQGGEQPLFVRTVDLLLPLLEKEEEFDELLHSCADFHRCLDHDYQERAIEDIIQARSEIQPEEDLAKDDPDVKALLEIVHLTTPPSH